VTWLVRAATAVALALAGPSLSSAHAQTANATEFELKAAYLYNFARFVDWPSATGGEFEICVLGADPFGPALDKVVSGLSVRGRRVATRRVGNPVETAGCQVLFIAASEDRQLLMILESLGARAVLTVSDMPQFARRGGMIQFVTDANRVRFDVNLAPARDAGLMMKSDLLRVARTVRSDAGGNRP
jgi:hypothetical protein